MAQKALSFDGTADYVTIPHAASIEFADEDFTVELWIKATEANLDHGDNLFLKGSFAAPQTGKRYTVSLDVSGDRLTFDIDDNVTKSTVGYNDLTNWADGDWHYFAFRRNTTTNKIEICLDGSQVAQANDNTGSIANGEPLQLACGWAGSSEVEAVFDEVRISRKYRTDAEILAIWNGGLGKKFEVDGDTEALWHMDEGADSTIYDETANDNDGTITGASWVNGVPFPIAPSAIPSAEAFGTAQLNLKVAPSAISSAEAFGTTKLLLYLKPSAIPSAEAFGDANVAIQQFLELTGIASDEAFGTPILGAFLLPSSIVSEEAFGNLVIAGPLIVPGIGSQEALGTLTVTPGGVSVAPSGISSEELFGLPKLNVFVIPSGIVTSEAFGAAKLNLKLILTAIASAEAFGTATVEMILVIRPSGIASVELFGTPILIVILAGGDGLSLPTAPGQASLPSGQVSIPSREVSI